LKRGLWFVNEAHRGSGNLDPGAPSAYS